MIRNATTKEKILDYCDQVISGEIVACKLVIKAVEKFLAELERSKREPDLFPYVFDWDEASDFCDIFPALLRHSKGEWAGHPFHLSPWQMFIVANVHGWKRRSDDTRRIRKVFVSVARKNGKTSLCAGEELIMVSLDGEPGAEVYIGATKLDQAKLIHDEAERMLKQSPHMARHADILKNNISFPGTNSFARPLGSDAPFDGLNPSATFFDELHAWKELHRKFYDTMTTGSGSRRQPIQWTITTAGDEKSLLYLEEYNYACGVVRGDYHDDSLFAMIFELDKDDDPFADEFDFELLIKSNPNLGVSVKREYLEEKLTEARNKPSAKNRFKRYHGNRSVSSVEDAISAEQWDGCAAKLSDWMESDGIGAGVDLGGRDDLAAYAMAAKFQIGEKAADDKDAPRVPIYRHEVRSRAFIAKDTKRDLTEEPFATWIHEGKLEVCEYVISELKERLLEDCQALGIEYVAYDPYQAAQLAEELEAEGLKPVKMAQNHGQFNETVQDYQLQVSEGRFTPDIDDEVLRWCALNMSLNRNSKDQVMPDKGHSSEKIDAAVAMLMAKRASNLALPRIKGSLVL